MSRNKYDLRAYESDVKGIKRDTYMHKKEMSDMEDDIPEDIAEDTEGNRRDIFEAEDIPEDTAQGVNRYERDIAGAEEDIPEDLEDSEIADIITELAGRQNRHPDLDIEKAFQHADKYYPFKSAHWQEAANREFDMLDQKDGEIQGIIAFLLTSMEAQEVNSEKWKELNEKLRVYQEWLGTLREKKDKLNQHLDPKRKSIFRGMGDSDFASGYDALITDLQGNAVPGFRGTCGINGSCGIINQQTGSDLTETEGVELFRKKGLCVTDCTPESNGGTTWLDRKKFLEDAGLTFERVEGSMGGDGFTLEEMAQRMQRGESAGLTLKAQDIRYPKLSSRSILSGILGPNPYQANHMTTVAGFSYDKDNNITGVWINDTGGWGESNRVFIDREKFYLMQKNTAGFGVEYSRKRER